MKKVVVTGYRVRSNQGARFSRHSSSENAGLANGIKVLACRCQDDSRQLRLVLLNQVIPYRVFGQDFSNIGLISLFCGSVHDMIRIRVSTALMLSNSSS